MKFAFIYLIIPSFIPFALMSSIINSAPSIEL